jgi:BirA family biotin operon repressor/biotin-[acetyl-CoA-carboxylase] ligase
MVSPYTDLDRPPLRASSLTRALVRPDSFWREVRILEETPSTNAVLAEEAAAGAAEGLVVVAEQQTAGRGRLDRTWSSPPRAGLTFSVLLRPGAVPDRDWTWVPLLTGLAVAESVETISDVGTRLKWPNDVLMDERKVAGVLVERHNSALIVGVGLNVTTTVRELPGPEAISLALAEAAVTDRETLLRAVLRSIAQRYLEWRDSSGDVARIAGLYADRCATLGADLRVALPDGTTVEGTGERIDEHGRLVVRTTAGEQTLSAGDVLHVRPR